LESRGWDKAVMQAPPRRDTQPRATFPLQKEMQTEITKMQGKRSEQMRKKLRKNAKKVSQKCGFLAYFTMHIDHLFYAKYSTIKKIAIFGNPSNAEKQIKKHSHIFVRRAPIHSCSRTMGAGMTFDKNMTV